MNDPDEIWLTADCSKCHLTLPDARWKDPGPCTLNLGCEKDGTRYTRADLAEAREKALADALRFYANPDTYFAIALIGDSPHGDFLTDIEEIEDEEMGCTVERPGKRAREALAAHDKRKGGDGE